jgi:transcriptional regulator with XRE-family HTH domain
MPRASSGNQSSQEHASVEVPTLGHVIRALRGRRAMSQKALALEAGVDQSVLAAIEHGRRPPPRDDVLQRLIAALSLSELELQELERGRVASRLVKALEGQPPATQAVIVEVALVLVRMLPERVPRA